MLITARLFPSPSVRNSLIESGSDLYLTCAKPVCGQGLDREWQLIHQSEQQQTHEEERPGSAHTLQGSSTSQLWDVAAQLSPLLGHLDLPGVFEDIVPGQRAAQPVKKTKPQNLDISASGWIFGETRKPVRGLWSTAANNDRKHTRTANAEKSVMQKHSRL